MKTFPIEEITKIVADFAQERDWNQFHSPKNISMALNVESSELMEMFQWLKEEESWKIMNTDKKVSVEDEIADVAVYLLRICDLLKIDLEEVIRKKMKKNAEKYPPELVRGSSKKYDEY